MSKAGVWTAIVLMLAGGWSLALAAEKGQDFSDQDLTKRNFAKKDLEKANFENADMIECNLTEVRAAGANFRGADLTHAVLRSGDFTGADFRKAKLQWCSTWDANMTGANFEGTDLSKVLLGRVNFRGANLRNLKGISSVEAANFRDADLRGAILTGLREGGAAPSKFRGAKYDKATRWPKGFDLEEAEVVLWDGKEEEAGKKSDDQAAKKDVPAGKDFSDQNLTKRDFSKKDLEKASFENADLNEANLTEARAAGATFRGADLSSAVLTGGDFSGADFRNCRVTSATLRETNFSGANFEGTDLSRVLLSRVNFRKANLRNLKGIHTAEGSDFRGADLRGAILTGLVEGSGADLCKYRGAKYDKSTRWPKGFDPVEAGAVLTEEEKVPAATTQTPQQTLQSLKKSIDANDKASFMAIVEVRPEQKPMLEILYHLLQEAIGLDSDLKKAYGPEAGMKGGPQDQMKFSGMEDAANYELTGDAGLFKPKGGGEVKLIRKEGVWKIHLTDIPTGEEAQEFRQAAPAMTKVFAAARKKVGQAGYTSQKIQEELGPDLQKALAAPAGPGASTQQ